MPYRTEAEANVARDAHNAQVRSGEHLHETKRIGENMWVHTLGRIAPEEDA